MQLKSREICDRNYSVGQQRTACLERQHERGVKQRKVHVADASPDRGLVHDEPRELPQEVPAGQLALLQ